MHGTRCTAGALLVVTAACFSKPGAPGTGGDANSVDSNLAPPSWMCSFPTATEITSFNTAYISDAAQSPDQLELYLARQDTPADGDSYNIYRVSRSSTSEPYVNLTYDMELSSTKGDVDPALTHGGLRIFLLSTRTTAQTRLYEATRESNGGAWGMPSEVSTSGEYLAGFDVSPDGRTLYSSDGAMPATLFSLARANDGAPFGARKDIAMDASNGQYPSIAGDQLSLYYSNGTIYRLTRTSTDTPFGSPEMIATGTDPDISDDGRTLIHSVPGNGLWIRQCQ